MREAAAWITHQQLRSALRRPSRQTALCCVWNDCRGWAELEDLEDLEDLEAEKAIFAALIARDGPKFLPLFLRLVAEEKSLVDQSSAIRRALELATRRAA